MKAYFDFENLHGVKSWCTDIEDGAWSQINDLRALPFVYKHIAIMPDCHQGYGMPIGGVLATAKVVIPNAVGVDIGCGMRAIRTIRRADDVTTEDVKKILGLVRETVPVGFDHHEDAQSWDGFSEAPAISVVQSQLEKATKSLGSLGGGNHFIEIQAGDDGMVWAMIHSGSRNFGYTIAGHYHRVAVGMCRRWYAKLPTEELSFLPIDDPQGREYRKAMEFALRFAKENRARMMRKVEGALIEVLGAEGDWECDIHHNYAAMENHFGKNVLVHRKGATRARKEEVGIIPGSQGTASYIVRGLGSPESFTSCSHGAGRRMGRNQARRELSLKDETQRLEGVVHSLRTERDLDEAPGAYKDIDAVMEAQSDLVEVVTRLRPLGVVKG